MSELVLSEERNGLRTLTLNRPESLNALNMAIFIELNAKVDEIVRHPDGVGCVLIRGAGKSFCAGADLKNRDSGDAVLPNRLFKSNVIRKLAELPMPVVAAVHGHCLTGGLELALSADIIIACESAKFADTHGKWGLVGAWGMTQRLPRRIGWMRAREMMFTGRHYSAAQAERMGLVNFCVPDQAFDGEVQALVASIVGNSWHTNRSYKRLLDETDGMAIAAGLAYEFHSHPGSAPDVKERIARFSKI